jgi:hypothetical protein
MRNKVESTAKAKTQNLKSDSLRMKDITLTLSLFENSSFKNKMYFNFCIRTYFKKKTFYCVNILQGKLFAYSNIQAGGL